MPLSAEQAAALKRGAVVILDDAPPYRPSATSVIQVEQDRRRAGRVWARMSDSEGPAFTVRWFDDLGRIDSAVMRDYELSLPPEDA